MQICFNPYNFSRFIKSATPLNREKDLSALAAFRVDLFNLAHCSAVILPSLRSTTVFNDSFERTFIIFGLVMQPRPDERP